MANVSKRLAWRKSSDSLNGDCVEVAPLMDGVAVRDSKDPDGSVLTFSDVGWGAFLLAAKRGEFDGP